MRRQLAAVAVMVMLLSLVTSIPSALAALPATAADPPEQVALDFFGAGRAGSVEKANSYVLPTAGDLGAQICTQISQRLGGLPYVQASVVSVRQLNAAITEVVLAVGSNPSVLNVTLTPVEAQAGSPWLVTGFEFGDNFRVDHEDLDISIDPEKESATGTASLDITTLNYCPELHLRMYPGLKVSGVRVDGRPASVVQRDGWGVMIILLPNSVPEPIPGATYTVSYRFTGTIDDKDSRGRAYMDILPEGAYFSDVFGDAAEGDVTVSVPKGWTVVTAGTPQPGDGGVTPDRQEFRFHRDTGRSTLIAVGKYTSFSATVQGIPVSWHLMPEHADQQELARSITDRTFAFALSHFGPPSCRELTIAEIPPQHGGGTESRDMIMLVPHLTPGLSARDTTSWDGLVSHELIHLWWGKGTHQFCYESLTNYAVDWMLGETDPAGLRASRAFHRQRYLDVPVAEDIAVLDTTNLYVDKWLFQVVYDKGAMVYGMLRYQIGDEAFGETIRRFATATVRSPEALQAIAEQASGEELGWFFNQWLNTTDRLDLSLEVAGRQKVADGFLTTLRIINDSPIKVRRVDVLIRTAAGDQRQIANLGDEGDVMSITTQSPVTDVILDPDGVYLDVDPGNNVVGFGVLDRGSPMRPWTVGGLVVIAVACLFVLAAQLLRRPRIRAALQRLVALVAEQFGRRDARGVLQRLASHFGFTYLRAGDDPHAPELFMAATRTFGSPRLAHNTDGGFPCAFGTYRGHLVVIRQPGDDDPAGLTKGIRIGVHFPHDRAGFVIRTRRALWFLRRPDPNADNPAFDLRFSLRAERGQDGQVLNGRARAAIVALGRTGKVGIRVTPYGAFYYATGPMSTSLATAALDALIAIVSSLQVNAG